jgi:hypothetical protein
MTGLRRLRPAILKIFLAHHSPVHVSCLVCAFSVPRELEWINAGHAAPDAENALSHTIDPKHHKVDRGTDTYAIRLEIFPGGSCATG